MTAVMLRRETVRTSAEIWSAITSKNVLPRYVVSSGLIVSIATKTSGTRAGEIPS